MLLAAGTTLCASGPAVANVPLHNTVGTATGLAGQVTAPVAGLLNGLQVGQLLARL
ncbi:hypothetical protein GCM10009665_42440 [Kitasatospora nipponensis]|uniref:Small secreted domain DUF320 n=1 Tax=Kitasatospora nipponensis TaxID=258049 RepID=A0ABN1WGJ7_9ACTN